ncbi:protein CNGC15b-like [Rutidosis leptorrhynchoides]|uniref:protein CNGC15b-like n=1 Tax=Rutidosis leptorrhynchoides TaxID=125765 RepID=UPI003A99C1F4
MASSTSSLQYLTLASSKTLSLSKTQLSSSVSISSIKPFPKLFTLSSTKLFEPTPSSRIIRTVAVSSGLELDEELSGDDEQQQNFSPDLKLFVGNLPFSVDSAALAGLFEAAGNVEMVEVIYDKVSGRSRGFGFVTMSSVEEVEEAVRKFNGYELDGREIRVNSGPPPRREESSFGGPREGGRFGGGGGGRSFDNTNRVYVGNLAWSVDNLALETLFREQGNVLEAKVLSRAFSEDYAKTDNTILDPRGKRTQQWNQLFLIAALFSLAVDPLFFYLPVIKENMCLDEDVKLKTTLTIIRTIVDVFYALKIYIRFRTAYMAPSSRLLGRGELILDSGSISERYLKGEFWLDFLATLPVPQVMTWFHILDGDMMSTNTSVLYFIMIQFFLRLYLTFRLGTHISKQAGLVANVAWVGAAYNLVLFMLAAHVIGAMWYLLSIERQGLCWVEICDKEVECNHRYFDCFDVKNPRREAWYLTSNVSIICADVDNYQYGLVEDSVQYSIASSNFYQKYSYCLWWGLRGLSSAGQELQSSPFPAETHFCILIAITGLILFALLIGNMQQYLESRTKRLEEYRVKRMDTEQWMHHRHLPYELRERVRKHDLYKWITTRGVDEQEILRALPLDIRRDIKRYVCAELVRRVPLFDQMDERTVDAICERLKPVIATHGTCLIREGDPTNEMLFIMRGHLDSYTTGGGRSGFFNQCEIGPGDFCGEELLTWALDPRPKVIIPSSTRTVTAITEVEAFALTSKDLKFVATQFRKLHSKKLRHTFRVHSHQWRTWAACFIQAAWSRYKRRKDVEILKDKESLSTNLKNRSGRKETGLAKLATIVRRGRGYDDDDDVFRSPVPKPKDPEFLDDCNHCNEG